MCLTHIKAFVIRKEERRVCSLFGRLRFMSCSWTLGKDTGTPLQYSCLENPMDGGAWWAAVYGVTQSWTRLKWLSSSSSSSSVYPIKFFALFSWKTKQKSERLNISYFWKRRLIKFPYFPGTYLYFFPLVDSNAPSTKILRRGGKNTQKNYTKKIFTTHIIMMVWSLT